MIVNVIFRIFQWYLRYSTAQFQMVVKALLCFLLVPGGCSTAQIRIIQRKDESMNRVYSNAFKKSLAQQVVEDKCSTKGIAEAYGVPLKTLEKWITAYRKDITVFDKSDDFYKQLQKERAEQYDDLMKEELIQLCKKKQAQIEYLESLVQVQESNRNYQR